MTLRAEVRAALEEHPEGLTGQQLFEACDSADDEKKFAQNLSALKGERKIKVVSTTEDEKPRAIYGIDKWDEKPQKPTGAEPVQRRLSAKEFARQSRDEKPKARGKRAAPRQERAAAAATEPTPAVECAAQFAINAAGELGIEKGDSKLRLEADEFRVMREFIERTQEVWDR